MWQAFKTVETASRGLCCRTDDFPLELTYSLPEGAPFLPAFLDLMTAAKATLIERYGKAKLVIDTQLQTFMGLPFAAVLAWLQSTSLITDCETSVFLLVCDWQRGLVGRTCTGEQLAQLHREIRYGQMPLAYIAEMCAGLPGPPMTRKRLLELWGFSSCRSSAEYVQGAGSGANLKSCPPPWLYDCRPTSCNPALTSDLLFEVPRADIRDLVDALSNPSNMIHREYINYAGGFYWVFHMLAKQGQLSCAINALGVNSLQDRTWQLFTTALPCSIKLYLRRALLYSNVRAMVHSNVSFGLSLSRLQPDHQGFTPHQLGWWDAFMENECIHFKADVKVDYRRESNCYD